MKNDSTLQRKEPKVRNYTGYSIDALEGMKAKVRAEIAERVRAGNTLITELNEEIRAHREAERRTEREKASGAKMAKEMRETEDSQVK